MKNLQRILPVILVLTLYSCTSQSVLLDGANSGFNYNLTQDDYIISQLDTATYTQKMIVGIPVPVKNDNSTSVKIKSLGGARIGYSPLPMITTEIGFIFMSLQGGAAMTGYDGLTTEAVLISVPFSIIGSALNQLLWSNYNQKIATQKTYEKLYQNNQEIDTFINPKIKIKEKKGVFSSESQSTIFCKGIKIDVD